MDYSLVKTVAVKSNYFKFKCDAPIFKYKVSTDPQIPSNQIGLLMRILSKLRGTIEKVLTPYQPFNFTIYSPQQADETSLTAEYENVNYSVKIIPSGVLQIESGDKEAMVFLGRFFKLMQQHLKLNMINRRYFNPNDAHSFDQWKLNVWPGYQTSLNSYANNNLLVNVDSCFKVIRETTLLDEINGLMSRFNGNTEKVKEEIIGMTVMTKYNKLMYKVDDIEFQMNPQSKFQLRDGNEITFAEYYEKKYNKKLNDPKQPLILNLKKRREGNQTVHLIPELCVLTGQSPEMRANFNLQKDLNRMIKPTPQDRLKQSRNLIQHMYNNSAISELMKKWSISIDNNPMKIEGQRINAGEYIMGDNNRFGLENAHDIDRKIQAKMLDQPQITKIGVFCHKRDEEYCRNFMDTLKKCVETFGYPMNKPQEFFIDGRDFDDWERCFKSRLDQSVNAVILLLPGKKKSSPFYDQCKHFLLTKIPVPSQVVLVSTIQAGKNVRSIINKVLIQLCAKVGGTPWAITDLPFTDKPTMIVGIDVFTRASMKKKSLLALCATCNKHFSRYYSTVEVHDSGEEIGTGIQSEAKKAMVSFKNTNGVFPQTIIVYRDGVSESQRRTLLEIEVKAFLRAFDEVKNEGLISQNPEFIFVCVNKKMTAKFFSGDNLEREGGNLSNPDQGTVIDKGVTGGKDFYLISQKTNQGSAAPTHYFVLSHWANSGSEYKEMAAEKINDDIMSKLQILTYKLCYLYYNWSGSIKVPAPIQYAQKLSGLIGDRWNNNNPMIPDKRYEDLRSLYFI